MTAAVPVFDARISLTTAIHAQPGVYALLLGSGTSTGAGVPTGWGVITALVTRAAAAAGHDVSGAVDPEQWWQDHGDGQPLGYSGLLAQLASTPGARRALLADFFQATDEEREQGIKVPGAAHRAIAELVRRGSIRVILTTNFDRLLEQALDEVGISPQVVATPSAIAGMEPLAHARCTVVKLHGDYTRLDQLNTVDELSSYDPVLGQLLERVLDEYGLIINGWSGDWDHALVAAIEGTRTRRYPLFWTTFGDLGDAAKRLVAQHRAQVITKASADQFFPELVDRLVALDSLADPPLNQAMAVARLKRMLPDPRKHIELRDLLAGEVGRLRDFVASRGQMMPSGDVPVVWQDAHDDIRRRCDTLLHLVANGVYLDRDRQHDGLWVWVIEQLMRIRQTPNGQYHERWVYLDHLPALLVLKAASLAAVAAGNDTLLLRLLREPMWRNPVWGNEPVAALDVLHYHRVLDRDVVNLFPRWAGARWRYPVSRLLKDALRPVMTPLVGDEDSYVTVFHRTEYRTALAQWLARDGGLRSGPESGEFIGDYQWRHGEGGTVSIWELDFRQHADRATWGWTPVASGEPDPFADQITGLGRELEGLRRPG
jgi:hypothetical protein